MYAETQFLGKYLNLIAAVSQLIHLLTDLAILISPTCRPYYLGLFKFSIGMFYSINCVLNRLVSSHIRGNTFCQLLALFDVYVNMPIYAIKKACDSTF
jgi:hypothetical protein